MLCIINQSKGAGLSFKKRDLKYYEFVNKERRIRNILQDVQECSRRWKCT